MAQLEFLQQDLYCGRKEVFYWEAYDDDGTTPIALAAGDVVRAKLAENSGAAPVLDLRSGASTPNDSTVVIDELGSVGGMDPDEPASGRVIFGPLDTRDLPAGWTGRDAERRQKKYFLELALVDDSETAPPDAIKVFGRGPLVLHASPGGNVGLTDPP